MRKGISAEGLLERLTLDMVCWSFQTMITWVEKTVGGKSATIWIELTWFLNIIETRDIQGKEEGSYEAVTRKV